MPAHRLVRETAISKDSLFDDCVILERGAFDPDAVFHEDIVDSQVLPYLSLAVDGFTDDSKRKELLELRPDDVAANDETTESTAIPQSEYDPEQLEVYGWESSLLGKLKGYIGL